MICEHNTIATLLVTLTFSGHFFPTAHAAAEVDMADLPDGPATKLTTGQSQMDVAKRMPGFVRIGRQGNFIRIGRPSSFVRIGRPSSFVRIGRPSSFVRIGKNSDSSYGQDKRGRTYKGANGASGDLNMMTWYPHLHRFIRIGRNSADRDAISDEDVSPDFDSGLTGSNEMADIGEKRSNFVRIGRGEHSISTLQDLIDFDSNEALKEDTKRRNAFVRVGKGLDDSSDEFGLPVDDGQGFVGSKRQSGFVRIGKSPEPYFEPYVAPADNDADDDDILTPSRRASNFVRIGKRNPEPMEYNLNNVDKSLAGKALNEGTAPRIGETGNVDFGKVKNNIRASSSDEAGHDTERRASSFVRIGKQEAKRSSETGQHQSNSIDLSNPQSIADDRVDHFIHNKRSTSPYPQGASSLERTSGEIAHLMKSRRALNPLRRRSAFVRIGKIPSSAFVRIGKNFNRRLPMSYPRHRNFRQYLRGHSSFVRIG